jgi:hypothetical protein
MEEPTMAEIVRDIQASLSSLADDVAALRHAQDRYVSRELYDLHREHDARQREADHKRVEALEERDKSRVRMLYSAGVLPLLVVLLAYALGVRP